MELYFTNDFYQQVARLIKKSKDGYQSCIEDIISFIDCSTLEGIVSGNPKLRKFETVQLLKIRLKNSRQKLSKRDGYRLIVVSNTKNQSLSLVYIYPKMGKYAQASISETDELNLLNKFLIESKNQTLRSFDYQLPDFLELFQK